MILIVDDLPENVFALKKVLEYHHFKVDTAFSGEEALRKILAHQYVLILLDVQMPGIDGFEVAENIKGYKKANDTAIVFLSANLTDLSTIAKGYQKGGVDYITKPVDTDLLLLKVKTIYKLYELKQDSSRNQQEIEILYNQARDYNQNLLKKVERLQFLLDWVELADWEYLFKEDKVNSSSRINEWVTGSKEISPDKKQMLSLLEIEEPDLEKMANHPALPLVCFKRVLLNGHEHQFKIRLEIDWDDAAIPTRLWIVLQQVSNLPSN